MVVNAQGTPIADAVVRPVDDAETALEIADGIFMSPDISNSYAVRTDAGAFVINTGTRAGGPKHLARYRKAGLGKVAAVVLTQHHTDHVGGLQPFLEDSPRLIASWLFPEGFKYHTDLEPYYARKQKSIWGLVLGDNMPPKTDFEIHADLFVRETEVVELGGRRFELFCVPGGETLDSLCVWMPEEKVVFTGNLFGPAFLTIPNLNTLRVDKPRSSVEYLRNADRVLNLGAELLVTGHGDPIHGKDRIAADVSRMRDCVQYIHDETVRCMVAGMTIEETMRMVTVPDAIKLNEWYGTAAWAVKTIWREYSGWWDQDFTSQLYPVALSDRFAEIVALAGTDALHAKGREHLAKGRAVEALQIAEMLLVADRTGPAANQLLLDALTVLLDQASGRRNLQETVWLRGQIEGARQRLAGAQ